MEKHSGCGLCSAAQKVIYPKIKRAIPLSLVLVDAGTHAFPNDSRGWVTFRVAARQRDPKNPASPRYSTAATFRVSTIRSLRVVLEEGGAFEAGWLGNIHISWWLLPAQLPLHFVLFGTIF